MKAILPAVFVFFCAATGLAEVPWNVGASSTVITPEKPMWMAGYGGRKAPSSGKLTELWAKALILEDAEGNRGVVISLDLVGIDRALAKQVTEQLELKFKLKREQVMICTSHTHSGPVVGKNLGALHFYNVDETQQKLILDYADSLVEKIVDTVGRAIDRMAPSRVQWGSGKATFAVNRRENKPYPEVPDKRARGILKGPVDHDVPVLSVRDTDGKLTAILFGYACHATVLGGQEWCGDYPGYAQIELEKANPGCVALFWAGCGGDQNPLPRKQVELAEEYGAELAEAVMEVITAPMPELPASLKPAYEEIDLELAQLPDRSALILQSKSKSQYEMARAKILMRQLEKTGAIKGHYPFPVAAWKLGNEIDFIALGGEVVVDYALRIKREHTDERTWVAGYTNDVMAYIPSLRVLKEGGYEGGTSNVYYGLPGLWSDAVEETILNAVTGMIREN